MEAGLFLDNSNAPHSPPPPPPSQKPWSATPAPRCRIAPILPLSPDHRPRHPELMSSKPLAPEQCLQSPRAVPDPLPVSLNIWYVDMAHWLINSVLLLQMRMSNPVTSAPTCILLAQPPASLPGLRLPAATQAPKASSKHSHLVIPVTSCPFWASYHLPPVHDRQPHGLTREKTPLCTWPGLSPESI